MATETESIVVTVGYFNATYKDIAIKKTWDLQKTTSRYYAVYIIVIRQPNYLSANFNINITVQFSIV